MPDLSLDFRRGAFAAEATKNLAQQLTTEELAARGDMAFDTYGDEPPAYHRGWDWAIRRERAKHIDEGAD